MDSRRCPPEDEENREKVRLVNVVGTQNIATSAKELGIKMMYIYTDYVFDGQGTTPWDPDCKAPTHPPW